MNLKVGEYYFWGEGFGSYCQHHIDYLVRLCEVLYDSKSEPNEVVFKVLHQWSKEELKAYDNVTIKEQDERGEREIVVQKALEKGEEKGREEMIIEMHKEGFSTRQIAKVSKKSEQEVTQIIDNHTNK